ncbi:MAG: cytochrome c [Solirubrobacterales bacterium]
MSKRTFIVFGGLVVVLAVLIPWLVFNGKGDAKNGAQDVPAKFESGQELFQINCGNCHTLYAAGTDGNYAPDLDELLAPAGPPEGDTAADTIKATEGRVLNAVENGVNGSTPGRMPGGILNEEQAKEVAAFVAATAGQG